jgi:hypothetical protein
MVNIGLAWRHNDDNPSLTVTQRNNIAVFRHDFHTERRAVPGNRYAHIAHVQLQVTKAKYR